MMFIYFDSLLLNSRSCKSTFEMFLIETRLKVVYTFLIKKMDFYKIKIKILQN